MTNRMKGLERGARGQRPLDARRHRALVGAMRGALRRSLVLLPRTEEDDLLQLFVEAALGAPA